MDIATLSATAKALVAPGKGILAADESSGTIKKRFDSIAVDSTEENRRDYREMLFTAKGVADYISGVILYDETIRQHAADGTPLVKVLEAQGIIPGIKVDLGAKPLADADGETVTEGLDGLRARLAEYRSLGARFAKWRATYTIGDILPSAYCIDVNAHAWPVTPRCARRPASSRSSSPRSSWTASTRSSARFEVTSNGARRRSTRRCSCSACSSRARCSSPTWCCRATRARSSPGPGGGRPPRVRCFKATVPRPSPASCSSPAASPTGRHPHTSTPSTRSATPLGAAASRTAGPAGAGAQGVEGRSRQRRRGRDAFLHRAKLNSAARSGSYTAEMEKAAS